MTYFADYGDPDFVEDLRWGDSVKSGGGERLLEPGMLRLTSSGQDGYGINLIYDVILETVRSRDAFLTHPSNRSNNPSLETIIEWPHIGQKYWDQLPKQSASSVFDQLI